MSVRYPRKIQAIAANIRALHEELIHIPRDEIPQELKPEMQSLGEFLLILAKN